MKKVCRYHKKLEERFQWVGKVVTLTISYLGNDYNRYRRELGHLTSPGDISHSYLLHILPLVDLVGATLYVHN